MPFYKVDGFEGRVHVMTGGPDRKILVDGKVIAFEDHPHFGPCPLKKNGDPKDLGPRHAFWDAVSCWYQQGKVIGEDGLCVWRKVDPLDGFVEIVPGSRHYAPADQVEHYRELAREAGEKRVAKQLARSMRKPRTESEER